MKWIVAVALMCVVGCGAGVGGTPETPERAVREYGMTCGATITGANGLSVAGRLDLHYFADGTLTTECSIGGSDSATTTYGAESDGALNGRCSLDTDVDAPSGGRWSFLRIAPAITALARYRDGGSANDGLARAIPCHEVDP